MQSCRNLFRILGFVIITTVLWTAFSGNRPGVIAQPEDKRPNILFILTDDQRWDTLGTYGNKTIRTPHLDQFASEGARLDAFYVAGPVCCASRAVFLTGLYPHETGVSGNGLDIASGLPTITSYLNPAGYATGFIGKAHLGGDPRKWGFQDCPAYVPHGGWRHKDPDLMVNGISKKFEGMITEIFTDTAIAFVEKHKTERWFLWFAPTAPHDPYFKDPNNPYKIEDLTAPPGWPKNQSFQPNKNWSEYYATITMLDREIGRLLKKIDDLGLRQTTFVFMTGDNGFMFGSHGYKGKEVWFDESARVPALARWPEKIKPNTQIKVPISSVDFVPTILELAHVEKRSLPLHGTNLIPLLSGETSTRAPIFSEGQRNKPEGGGSWKMVRSGQYKYVRFNNGEEHLYDLVSDPSESVDLIQEGKPLPIVKELRQQLDRWFQATPVQSKPLIAPKAGEGES